MVETGIYNRLKEEETRRKYSNRKPAKQLKSMQPFEPMGLDGAIVTIFILCGGIISGVGFVFLAEIRYRIFAGMKNFIISLSQTVSKTFLKWRVAIAKKIGLI